MNKLFTSLLILFITVFATQTLNANCTGTSEAEPVVLCGITEAYNQAIANCCAGNVIYYYDECNDVSGSWTIGTNGQNALCEPD